MKTLIILLSVVILVLVKHVKGQSCGTQAVSPHGLRSPSLQIVGGKESVPHSWPWQVVLEYRGSFVCGGALVEGANGDIVVVTAAHCTDGTSAGQWRIRVGVHSRSANEANHKTYAVSAVINHGSYSAKTLRNDIAIMKLSTTVETNAHVSPICITNVVSSDYVGQGCVVTGWGTTSEGGSVTDKLQEVYKPIISDAECGSKVSGFHSTTMICAGLPDGGVDACQGDSGGPYACKDSKGHWDLVGIVSWGYGCARPELPGVYSDVHNYISWLQSNTS